MTNKQIIIDGVDVSGCSERSMCINCETVTNCHYKQLKRKEQECEELTSKCSQLEEKNNLLEEYATCTYYGFSKPEKLIFEIGEMLDKDKK